MHVLSEKIDWISINVFTLLSLWFFWIFFYSVPRVCSDLVKPFRSVSILIEHLLNRRVSVFYTQSLHTCRRAFIVISFNFVSIIDDFITNWIVCRFFILSLSLLFLFASGLFDAFLCCSCWLKNLQITLFLKNIFA